jgi:dipeptidyl aminopeptidase/acylaminoacyl peptidase
MAFNRIVSGFLMLVLLLWLASSSDSKELSSASTDHKINVRFNNGDVTLSGTLYLPTGAGPHPAIVKVHGSGQETREGRKSWAEYFAARGIAVLTYDKRGVGDSEGTYTWIGPQNSEAVFDDLADDALAGVSFLKNRRDINSDRIGLVGASQAGWIIPLAASKSKDVAFIVLLVGPTVSVGEEMYYSEWTGDDRGSASQITIEEASEKTREYAGEHGFDPLPSLETLSIPGLWILGAQDRSIPVPLCVEILENLIDEHSKDFRIINYPGGNHNLRDVNTRERLPALQDAFQWISKRVDIKSR